jgi:DNA-binding MarR family transcriptional regulator
MDGGLAARGLTRARAELLWRLGRQGPQTQRALSQLLQCTPRNVTGLVDALEAAGFVTREPHPSDRRATVVSLAKRGAAATARMESEYQEAAKALFVDLDPVDLEAFAMSIDRVLVRLHGRAAASSASA